MQARINALTDHMPWWMDGMDSPAGSDREWRGGFVIGVWLPWSGDTLAVLERLLIHPTARFLTALNLRENGIGDQGAEALARSGLLRSFTELDLWFDGIGDQGGEALACSESLRSLVTLRLGNNVIGDRGAAALARSETLCSLADLDLSNNRIGPDGAEAFARSGGAGTGARRSLVALDLSGNDIGDQGAAALSASEHLRGCRVLV